MLHSIRIRYSIEIKEIFPFQYGLFLCKNVRFVMERREFKYSIIRY